MTSRTELLLPDLESGEGDQSPLPAFVIDTAAGALVAANAAGWQAWGLAAGDASDDASGNDPRPVALDQAMPALARLQAAHSSDGETLTFWTARGLLHLRCRVTAIAGEPDLFLVRALENDRPGDHSVPSQPSVRAGAGPSSETPARAGPAPGRVQDMARLAHEVRTPLSAAIAYAELLKEEHFGPLGSARYREYARHAYDSARLALSVVDGMLARELRAPGQPARRDLPELAFRDLDAAGVIDNCVAVARPLAERAGLALTASYHPGTPRIIADEVSLKQMLLNLITNAIKFARPGDRVTLAAAYGDDGCLRIEVADTGPGMPSVVPGKPGKPAVPSPAGKDAAAAPLPPWAAAEDAAGSGTGHGIGLPLTRALAEANGATLIVDSTPGHGTRVTIAFSKDRVVPV